MIGADRGNDGRCVRVWVTLDPLEDDIRTVHWTTDSPSFQPTLPHNPTIPIMSQDLSLYERLEMSGDSHLVSKPSRALPRGLPQGQGRRPLSERLSGPGVPIRRDTPRPSPSKPAPYSYRFNNQGHQTCRGNRHQPYPTKVNVDHRVSGKSHSFERWKDVHLQDFVYAAKAVGRKLLGRVELTPYQDALLERGLVETHDIEDQMVPIVDLAIGYSAAVGLEAFQSMDNMSEEMSRVETRMDLLSNKVGDLSISQDHFADKDHHRPRTSRASLTSGR